MFFNPRRYFVKVSRNIEYVTEALPDGVVYFVIARATLLYRFEFKQGEYAGNKA